MDFYKNFLKKKKKKRALIVVCKLLILTCSFNYYVNNVQTNIVVYF